MKHLLLIIFFGFFTINCFSQSLEQAKQHLYYEKWNSAEEALQKIINTQPEQADAYYYLCEMYMNEHKNQKAESLLQKVKGLEENNSLSLKDHPLILVARAHWFLNKGKKEEADKILDDLMASTKYKDPELLMAGAKAYIFSPHGDPAKAIAYLEKAEKKSKKNALIYLLRGDAFRKQEDASNAYTQYIQALKYNPTLAEAHHKLGEIFKSQKNIELFLPQFTEAVAADKKYVPSILELYDYNFNSGNFDQAKEYMDQYIALADPSVQVDYMKANLFYVTKKYPEAIQTAKMILSQLGDSAKPRLYKMIAYCYEEEKDSANALTAINNYFSKENRNNYVLKDFDLKARLLEKNNLKDEAINWYSKALDSSQKDEDKEKYMRKAASLCKELKKYPEEALWREKIYAGVPSANNVDLFNWGVATYFSGNYSHADSVFGLYATKYPEQLYGYQWRARCNAAIDTSMELGLAIPHYEKLIEVAEKDKQTNKALLISSYNYLGGYEANIKKDYQKSIDWFNKVLEIDAGNADAIRYTEILKKWVDQKNGTDNTKTTEKSGSTSGAGNSGN